MPTGIGGYPLDGKGAVWRLDVASTVDKSSEEFLSVALRRHRAEG
jgi:hypothetical protein